MSSLQQLPLDSIRACPDQPRKTFYEESLDELAASIKERGVLQPIVVRPVGGDRYEIVMGERRWRASKMAGLAHIPAVVKNYASAQDAAADALLENFQREDMNPIEKALAIQGLLGMMSNEKVCRSLGISETTMRRSLELLELPPAVQGELVRRPGDAAQSTFGEGHARALLPLNDDPTVQSILVAKIKKERLSVARVELLVSAVRTYPEKKMVFLHVSGEVADQMLRSLAGQEERSRPYKAQTAKEHLRIIDKQLSPLHALMDDRVVEFLDADEMQHLMASVAQAARCLDQFNLKLREALVNKDFGFREAYTHCPLCGRIELVGALRCAVCFTYLKRCEDCGNFNRNMSRCGVSGAAIDREAAACPVEKSASVRCGDYEPRFVPLLMAKSNVAAR